jgi:hypothetical protein
MVDEIVVKLELQIGGRLANDGVLSFEPRQLFEIDRGRVGDCAVELEHDGRLGWFFGSCAVGNDNTADEHDRSEKERLHRRGPHEENRSTDGAQLFGPTS